MARTPHGSWRGCAHFGLRELLEQSTRRPETMQLAVDEINHALDDLGIVNFRVESIMPDSSAGSDVNGWLVTLSSGVDRTKTYSFDWNRVE
jgi:hypothetical protein